MDTTAYLNMAQVEQTHWWFEARRKIIQSILTQYRPHNEPLSILEVGCGTGGNIKMLGSLGQVEAIEPHDLARDIAQKKTGCKIQAGFLPDGLPEFEKKFDLIIALDVFEHLKDDKNSLETLKSLLNDDGIIAITVPAFPFLWSDHDVRHHHFRRYTKKSLAQLLNINNLTPIKLSYFNTILFPLVASIRLLKKLFLSQSSSKDEEQPSPFVNWALEKIFTSEKHLLKWLNLPFGVSLVAIAKIDTGK